MKMVNDTKTAGELLTDAISQANYYLSECSTADTVAVRATKAIVENPAGYRDYLLSLRNDAIKALDELNITHDFTDNTPNISG